MKEAVTNKGISMLIAKLKKTGAKMEIPANNSTELRNKVRTFLIDYPEFKVVEIIME